jgi:uncharacterized protein (UPF0303 family)
MSVDEDIARVAEQERQLVFSAFNETTAHEIGESIRSMAETTRAAIVIDVRFWERPLYYCAMPGSNADNVDWVRRKSNCVKRFGLASFAYTLRQARDGKGFAPDHNVDPCEIAAHGGSFPIRVIGVGVVGAITVSGLPGRRDHGIVVEAICRHLGIDAAPLALPTGGVAS